MSSRQPTPPEVSIGAVAERPWLTSYGLHAPTLSLPTTGVLQIAERTLADLGDRPFLLHHDDAIRADQLRRDADAVAAELVARGFRPGDRLLLQVQNTPTFVTTLLATWKAGGIVVTANPMYKARETAVLARDSGARVLVTLPELVDSIGPAAHAAGTATIMSEAEVADAATARRGQAPKTRPDPQPDDVAALVYTSGTTGPPKGAMLTHRNLLADCALWSEWLGVGREDVIMGVAPFFHITGLAAHVVLALSCGAQLAMAGRFEAGETLRLIETHRATFMVAAVTAYTALMTDPTFPERNLSSLRVTASGGAPVAPAIADRWARATGRALQNCYGLTETTALVLLTPAEAPARTDPSSGALSVGIPVSDTVVEIHDDDGRPVATGEIGELVISGPQVVDGYWRKPEESRHALPDRRLRTGDVGFMDADGWFYLVDRRKDLIVASGYKIWPREVEDVLAEHPAVREAAVIGVPDEYRGETVKAFVSLLPGQATTEAALIAFCRERLAAFKYPRVVEIVDELPKTASGKILRRNLRGDR